MPECIHISLYKSFEIAPNISYTILFIVNCNECLLLYHRHRGALSDTEIRLSVCPSPRRTADLGYSYAGCLQLSHVRTRPRTDVDPPRFLPLLNCHRQGGGHIVSPPAGRYFVTHSISQSNSQPDTRQSLTVARLAIPLAAC